MDTQVAKKIAAQLLEIGAVKLSPNEPFTWASGWKSPIYCDNRLTLSYPEVRSFIKNALTDTIRTHFADAEVIAGVATAGIPQAALIAEALGLPLIYIRAKPKGHGMTNLIEGKISPGKKVVVVEDLVSTGGSSLKAAQAIREAGMEVAGMIATFTYDFDIARQNFGQAQVQLKCLCTYSTLLIEAVARDYIAEEEMASLQEWRLHPDQWMQEESPSDEGESL
jgi:orotate phosphoribosyltransferase